MSENDQGGYSSGELARLAGVSTDTLRHYERKGVLPRASRLANGYRRYPAASLDRVRLVRAALAHGFTLDELADVMRARTRGAAPCRTVRALAAAKLEEAEARLRDLTALVGALRALLAEWDERLESTPGHLPARLLESLDSSLTSQPSLRRKSRIPRRTAP